MLKVILVFTGCSLHEGKNKGNKAKKTHCCAAVKKENTINYSEKTGIEINLQK